MKVRKNKLLQKILMVMLTTLILFNFIMPTVAIANDDEKEIGGGLFTPIQALLVELGDAIMRLMQIAFTGSDSVVTTIKPEDTDEAWWMPADSEFDWREDVNWEIITDKKSKRKVKVPTIEISPESIFSGKIPAFDINFFSPSENTIYENFHWEEVDSKLIYISKKSFTSMKPEGEYATGEYRDQYGLSTGLTYGNKSYEEILKEYGWTIDESKDKYDITRYNHSNKLEITGNAASTLTLTWTSSDSENEFDKSYRLVYTYSADRSGATGTTSLYENKRVKVIESAGEKKSIAGELRDTISFWYNNLRNIAIIGLLSVLVYVGIRIVLSSAAADKSKYKEMLKDWAVAMCLLFFMHYFMNFTVTIIESVSEALMPDSNVVVTEKGIAMEQYTEETTNIPFVGDRLVGEARIRLQTGDASQHMAYTIIYIVLIVYTFIFAIMYLKRVLYMAFFTMMAPLVALTYPIDKARDGKAQAFDMWIKEYTFNALIQPFHLIIYYVLVASALELASSNPMYSLVAIGFMMPAEKLLRKFFGFNKSETSGALGGALGGAMLMQGVNALRKVGSSGGKKGGSGSAGGQDKNKENSTVRTADDGNTMNSLVDSMAGENGGRENPEGLEGPENPGKPGGLGPRGLTDEEQEEKRNLEEYFKNTDNETADLDRDQYQANLDRMEELERLETEIDPDDDYDPDDDENTEQNEEVNHKFAAAASIGGRWLLKGGLGAAKLAARGTAAATLTTVGVAAGLASDDYSNVLKYGAAGLATGNAVAGAGINRVSKLPSDAYRVKNSAEALRYEYMEKAYGAKKAQADANKRADDAFMRNKEAIKLYKSEFNEKEYIEAMEAAKAYRAYGITDDKVIIKAMKLNSKGLSNDKADRKRILVAGAAPTMNKKDLGDYVDRLKSRGFSQKAAQDMKRAISDYNDWA